MKLTAKPKVFQGKLKKVMEKVMEFEVLKRVRTLGLQLDWKNNIFSRARFFVHFFAVATQLQPVIARLV